MPRILALVAATLMLLIVAPSPAQATTLLSSTFGIDQAQGWPVTDQNQTWICGLSSSYSDNGFGYVETDSAHSPKNCWVDEDHDEYEIFGTMTVDPVQSGCGTGQDTCEVTQGFMLRVQDPAFDTRHYFFLELVCRWTDGSNRNAKFQDQVVNGTLKHTHGNELVPGVDGNPAPCSSSSVYNVRVQIREVTGATEVRGKAWVDGGTEPDWLFEDSFPESWRPSTGGIGYQGASPAANQSGVTYTHGLGCIAVVTLPGPASCN
jgi:hypothetical protein